MSAPVLHIHMLFLAYLVIPAFALSAVTVNKRKTYVLKPWQAGGDQDAALGEVQVEYAGETLKVTAAMSALDENVLKFQVPIPTEEGNIASSLWPISCTATMWWNRYGKTLLQSTSKNKPVRFLELGSGLGVTGYAAGTVAARYADEVSLVLSDQDQEALARLELSRQQNNDLKLKVESRFLDWRDVHQVAKGDAGYDFLIGSDCAYYHHLVGPLADTIETFGSQALVVISGPASRQGMWELYHLIKDGGYNVKTDAYCEPWPGTVQMLFYRMYCQEDKSSSRMAVLCWTQNSEMMKGLQSVLGMEETFVATVEDEAAIEMGF